MTLPLNAKARVFTTEKQKVSTNNKNNIEQRVVVNLSPESNKPVTREVSYPPTEESDTNDNPYEGVTIVNPSETKTETNSETKSEIFYRTLLEAYMNNPLYVNSYIVMKASVLAELIKVMTDAEEVEITHSCDITCCSRATPYNLIDSIVVIKNKIRNDLEITYNDVYRKLKDYRVSLKFTID